MHPVMILEQDKARPHTARVTQQYLQQNDVHILPWPAYSPDLNPLEHLWDYLKRKIHSQNIQKVDQLQATLVREWNAVQLNQIRRPVGSMRRSCTAVALANVVTPATERVYSYCYCL